MAEKEERIVILTTKPKGNCPNQIDKDYCKETCWVKGKCSLGITRQEAIKRIAKAIKSVPKASGEAVHSTDYAKWAEAALNALLEKKC